MASTRGDRALRGAAPGREPPGDSVGRASEYVDNEPSDNDARCGAQRHDVGHDGSGPRDPIRGYGPRRTNRSTCRWPLRSC